MSQLDRSFANLPKSIDSVRRSDLLNRLQRAGTFDIVVVGGGIHGANVARLAAALGFKTALFERSDYASATSSRSSKLAHGGLRYLELFDFEQVFEGIRAREEMFENIGYLVRPAEFLIGVPSHAWFFRTKISIGLSIYDLLVKKSERRHRWVPRRDLDFPGFGRDRADLMGCFVYTDGIMSDTRLVIDNIIAARRYGALCLNHCGVTVEKNGGAETRSLVVNDHIAGKRFDITARLVINCAGPWAAEIAESSGGAKPALKFSRGSHIVFNKPWSGPCLFVSMPQKARYYFVLPHPVGTLVGTTEREVESVDTDPQPSRDEVEEILDRLQRDVPHLGLTADRACYAFAGVRTLPLRGRDASSSVLSRKHIWQAQDRVLTLLGGKYTTAPWTAMEGITEAAQILGQPLNRQAVAERRDLKELPGSCSDSDRKRLFEQLSARGITAQAQQRLFSRYGARLNPYLEQLCGAEETLVELETIIALDTEQVESLDDLMRRRLELEYAPDHGKRYLPLIASLFARLRPDIDFDSQHRRYLERLSEIDKLLGR